MCHSQLADGRPAAEHLTDFYFWVALGGALGGVFNTLVAPLVFRSVSEFPVMIVVACAARALGQPKGNRDRFEIGDLVVAIAIGAFTMAIVVFFRHVVGVGRSAILGLLTPSILAFSQSRRPLRFALAIATIQLSISMTWSGFGRVLEHQRTFFGVYRVTTDATGSFNQLFHGTTLHGSQAIDPNRRHEPLTYYHWTGPFGQAFAALPQLAASPEVAVVGLGVGSLATYARPAQRWTFYEIDPAVERIARDTRYFTYLADCGERCQVVIGDARLSLRDARSSQYGLIVLDAFSSDAIPIHLLTREALGLYLSRLSANGVIAFHISNRHLKLAPVLARLASDAKASGVVQIHTLSVSAGPTGVTPSEWVFVSRDANGFDPLLQNKAWSKLMASGAVPLWTDDFSNILTVLTWR
jgi:hypothetical protein